MEPYKVVRYEPRYSDELVNLLAPLWGSNLQLNKAYLRWKHLQNPYAKEPIIHLAIDDGRLIGVRAYLPSYWQFDDPARHYRCLSDVDAFVRSDYRRRGVLGYLTSTALEEITQDSYDYLITLSGGSPYSVAVNLRRGYVKAGDLTEMKWAATRREKIPERLIRLITRIPLLRRAYCLIRESVKPTPRRTTQISCFAALERNCSEPRKSGKTKIVLARKPRPEAMAAIAAKRKGDWRLQQVRDFAFYSWRYRNPLSVYRFLYSENTRLEGFIVLQKPAQGATENATLVEWNFNSIEILYDLVKTAIKHGNFNSLQTWSTTLTWEEREAFENLGFFDVDATIWNLCPIFSDSV